MDEERKQEVAEKQRAIIEAGRLIDLLSDERPDVQAVKDQWYVLGKCLRAAIKEIRQAEAMPQNNATP